MVLLRPKIVTILSNLKRKETNLQSIEQQLRQSSAIYERLCARRYSQPRLSLHVPPSGSYSPLAPPMTPTNQYFPYSHPPLPSLNYSSPAPYAQMQPPTQGHTVASQARADLQSYGPQVTVPAFPQQSNANHRPHSSSGWPQYAMRPPQ